MVVGVTGASGHPVLPPVVTEVKAETELLPLDVNNLKLRPENAKRVLVHVKYNLLGAYVVPCALNVNSWQAII